MRRQISKIGSILLAILILLSVFLVLAHFKSLYYPFYSSPETKSILKDSHDFLFCNGMPPKEMSGQEIAHLTDVKVLFQYIKIFWALLLLVVFSINRKFRIKKVRTGFYLLLLSVLGLISIPFFGFFFSKMHSLFFNPGSWIFPMDSLIIQVFPFAFFKVFFIIFISINILIGLFLVLYFRKNH